MFGAINISGDPSQFPLRLSVIGNNDWGIEFASTYDKVNKINNSIKNNNKQNNVSTFESGMGLRIRDDEGYGFYIRDNVTNQNRLVITGGNIGIATNSPAYTLDVNGTINATNILQNGQALGPWTLSHSNLFYNDGNVGIGTSSPTHTLDVNGTINATNILENGQALGQWSVSGNNLYYSNGNVGIGGINNNSGTALNIYSNNFPLGLNNNVNNYNRIYTSDPGGNSFMEISGGTNGYFNYGGSSLSNPLFRINNNGNVGIGTASPTHTLEVNGSFAASSYGNSINISSDASQFPLRLSAIGDNDWGIEFTGLPANKVNRINNGNNKLNLKNNSKQNNVSNFQTGMGLRIRDDLQNAFYIKDNVSNQYRLVINQGNIGIGTTSPAYKLDVNGTVNATNIYQNGQPIATSQWQNNSVGINYSNGLVGIGTSNPILPLTIHDPNNLVTGIQLGLNSINTNNFHIVNSYNGYLQIYNGNHGTGTRVITFENNGNVGIGVATYNSDAKLAVDGTIKAKEIIVSQNTNDWKMWPDYVFEKDYKSISLEEIEKYISKNKHLPEIESASELEQKGINIAEMETKLLKKVEELTLYIIEQNKKIKELQSIINNN